MKAIAIGSGVPLLFALIWATVNHPVLVLLLFFVLGAGQLLFDLGGSKALGPLAIVLLLIGLDCDCD